MRVALVEDDGQMLERLALALHGEAGIEIVGAYASGEAALEGLGAAAPEAMLVGLHLNGMTGTELIGRIRARGLDIDVVAHMAADDPPAVIGAIRAGACGYLLKGTPLVGIIEAFQGLARGGAPLTPRIARMLIRELQAPSEAAEGEVLSVREREVLKEIELGNTYAVIAQRLGISQHTVNAHVKNAYRKLQASDRAHALALARRKGLI
jgi:DNA-binding NarL/FixJ family response regulator